MDPFQVPQQPICTPSGKPVRGTGTTTSVWIQDWDSYWTIMQKQSPGSASFKSKLYFSLSQFPSSKVASEQRSSNNGDHEHSAHFITRDYEAFACRIIWQKVQRVPAQPKVGWQGRQSTTVHFFLNKSWWSVGSEGAALTGGSVRVQRHPSQVSVRRGKFYSLTVTSHRVKFTPTYRDLGGVSLDS